MAKKNQSSGLAVTRAIRAEQQSTGKTDRSNLNDTLVKSPLWKKKVLQAVETVRSGDSADAGPAVLHTLKQSLLELIEQHWQELVSNVDPKTYDGLIKQSCNPTDNNDDFALREANMQQESKSMRKELALNAKKLKSTRRRLRKLSATLEGRIEEIERLRQTIGKLEAQNASLTAEHQEELQAQNASLTAEHQEELQAQNASLIAEHQEELEAQNASLTAEHQEELEAHRAELLELQEAYDRFEKQSDLVVNEVLLQNERLRVEGGHENRRSLL